MALTDKIIGTESGGDRYAKNPRSSAYGPGQFINSTWLDMIYKYRPDLASGKSQAEILAMRSDPALSKEMTGLYAQENQAALKKAGFDTGDGNTYLAHFAGPEGATKILSNPQGYAADTLAPSAVAANPFLKDWTNQQVIDWATKKVGDPSIPDVVANAKSIDAQNNSGGMLSNVLGTVTGNQSGTPNIGGVTPGGIGAFALTAAGIPAPISSVAGGFLNSIFGSNDAEAKQHEADVKQQMAKAMSMAKSDENAAEGAAKSGAAQAANASASAAAAMMRGATPNVDLRQIAKIVQNRRALGV